MKFSLFLDQCGNSSCIRCWLDLYIHLSNDHGSGLFLSNDLNGLVQIEQFVALLYFPDCSWVSQFHKDFIGQVLSRDNLLRLGPDLKTSQWSHPLYLLWVVQSIAHHCISRRSSSHMVSDAGIGRFSMVNGNYNGSCEFCLSKTLLKSV